MKTTITPTGNLVSESAKKKSKRSMMLKMVMPLLSGGVGEELAEAIDTKNGSKAELAVRSLGKKLKEKIDDSK